MKKIYLGLIVFSISFNIYAQTVNLGEPIGWNGKATTKLIPNHQMSSFNQNKIDAEDLINDASKDRPWRFGYKYDVNFSLQNSGIWTTLPSGDRLWQIAIECKGAT